MKRHTLFNFVLALIIVLSSCEGTETSIGTNNEDINISQNISNQRISGITQDDNGYIWLATYRGLNRLNGSDVHQYFCDDKPESLPDNQTWDVYKDSTGRIWVATKNGVSYYTKEDNFHKVGAPASSQMSQKIRENNHGEIFVLQPDQILKYDADKDSLLEIITDIPVNTYTVNGFYIDSQDIVWVVSRVFINCYSTVTGKLIEHIDCESNMVMSSNLFGNELWLGTQEGIKILDVVKHQWIETDEALTNKGLLGSASITCIFEMPNNRKIICTNKGLYDYNPVTKILRHQSDPTFPIEAPNFTVQQIFFDKQSNIWFCSDYQGYEIRSMSNAVFNNDIYLCKYFEGKPVVSLSFDGKENLYIATDREGVYSYNINTKEVTSLKLKGYTGFSKIEGFRLYSVFVDSNENIWVNCVPYGTILTRREEDNLRYINSYNLYMPIVISEDKNKTIWVGTYSNLYYSKRNNEEHFEEHRILSNTFTYMSCIKSLPDGSLATLVKGQAIRIADFEKNELKAPEIPDDVLKEKIARSVFLPSALAIDRDGLVWIGTVSNGLFTYNTETKELNSISGIPCADISSIEEDADGNIWVSTQYGLNKYDRETNEFSTYYESNGIGGNEFYDRCSCKLPDGRLIFGGAHGLTTINPLFMNSETTAELYLEDLRIHNEIVRPGKGMPITESLSTAKEIRLNSKQNSFSIAFSTIDFDVNSSYEYRYKLDGFNRQWVETSLSKEALFSNLEAGKYTFTVQAIQKSNHQIVDEKSIKIIVEASAFASWWAKLIYAILAAIIVYVIVNSYRRIRAEHKERLQAERQKDHEKRINEMNMSFFANVSHEFRTPLTLISGPVAQLINDDSLPKDARNLLTIVQHSVDRMLRLVNQMMDFHKLEDDTLCLEVKRLDIIRLLKQNVEPFKHQAKEKNLTLTTKGLEDTFLLWVDADKIEKVIYNLLGNATKYTPSGGRIELSVDVVDRKEVENKYEIPTSDTNSQYFKIEVADTGDGIPSDKAKKIFERYYQLSRQSKGQFNWGTGIGLYYTKKLVTMHHGYIAVENRENATGAIFSVILPTSDKAYKEEEKSAITETQTSLYPIIDNTIPEQENTTPNEEAPNRPTVLVIDDDVEIVHYTKTMLQSKYNVICRFDAASALELLKEKEPDVILSDVMMPGVDGFDFCQQIKSDIQLCHIPVVLITAKTTSSDQIKGLDSGANAYVTKPFNPQYLLALIENLLKGREKVKLILGESTQTENIEEDVLTPQDNAFMTDLYEIMEKELQNPDLDVAHITEMLHISRTKLYYKVKGLTGQNPSVFFKTYKLNRAAELIKEGRYNFSEISDLTGFSSLSHFSASFKKQFGVSPSEYK